MPCRPRCLLNYCAQIPAGASEEDRERMVSYANKLHADIKGAIAAGDEAAEEQARRDSRDRTVALWRQLTNDE